jgi:DNA-binding NarL/FixJ family response regulator
MRCRVLIWSARPAFVKAMRSLAYREGLEVVEVVRTPEAALACVRAGRPHVVLVDRETEETHPGAVVRLMVEGAPAKVVAVDLVDDAAIVLEGRRAPAATVRDLLAAIEGGVATQAA